MRNRTLSVFGIAVATFSLVGCAANRRANHSSDVLSWEVPTSATAPQSPYRQYGLSVSPYPATQPSAAIDARRVEQFNFAHPRVDSFVTRFQTDLRGFFTRALSRSGRYVPKMSTILEHEGLPQELAYLPLIESGFQPSAVSRAGAVGPWQLIPDTGRRYGLRIDRYVDERRDPVKSTQAAARYLRDLYAMFGDWHLSLAAYNTGEQHIMRNLERGRADDYWEMSDRGYLCQETEDYVPEFLAALQIAEAPEAYGFDRPDSEPLRYDLVHVDRPIALSKIAELTGASPQEIRELNPALHRGIVPPQGYAVRVPKGTKESFEIAYAGLPVEIAVPRTRHGKVRHLRRHGVRHRGRRGAVATAAAHSGRRVIAKAAPARHLRVARAAHAAPVLARRSTEPVLVARQRARSRILD